MNGTFAIQIEIEVENKYQKTIRVVTIVPLQQSLKNESREPGRVLGRRAQPSEKKSDCYLPGFQNPEGSREKTVTLCFYELIASGNILN